MSAVLVTIYTMSVVILMAWCGKFGGLEMKRILGSLVLLFAVTLAAEDLKTVSNAMEPAGKAVTFELVEDLVVAPDPGNEMTIWPSIASTVDADAEGNMFVCDTGGNRILEFDKEGKFIKVVGQQGSGPGEFQALKSFQILSDGTGIAFENLQVVSTRSFFDKDMKYVDKKSHQSMENIISSAFFSPDGQWSYSITSSLNMQERKIVNKFAVLDADFNIKLDIMGFDSFMPDPSQFGSSDYWAKYIGNNMKQVSKGLIGFAAFDDKGNVYTAKGDQYEITKYNSKLEPQFKFSRKYKPIPMTEEEIKAIVEPIYDSVMTQMPPQIQSIITENTIKKAVEFAEFPAVKNPIAGLKSTPEGYLLVIHDTSMSTKRAIVDIFSSEGQFLGSFTHDTLGTNRMVFKNGYAYTLENRDDENHLVRYKVNKK